MIKGKCFILIVTLLFSIALCAQTATGNIENYLGNIIDNSPGSTGDNYVEPSVSQLTVWNLIIDSILTEGIANARTNANSLNYQITEFTDTSISPNQLFYVLEEKSLQSNYWGTYVFSKTPTRNNLIIQSPHSKYDTNTGKQAVYCFKTTGAKAIFINGLHRCNSDTFSSCSGTTSVCGASTSYRISDMAHTTTSIFQKTTEILFSNISNSVFIQLHGFGKQSSDPYVIMSNGTRETPITDYATLIKDALLIEDTSLTFELAHINTSWTRLIGFTNTQGRLINNSANYCSTSSTTTSGRFIHIEQEKSKLRDNEEGWVKMSTALSNVFSSTLSVENFNLNNRISIVPNPTSGNVYVTGENIREIVVYNSLGQRIISLENKMQNRTIFIDLNMTTNGIYFLKIALENGVVSKKVVHF
jgi:hypothetical protein